jgi:hypothetical protein
MRKGRVSQIVDLRHFNNRKSTESKELHMKAFLAGVAIALLAGTVALQADEKKTVKVALTNKTEFTVVAQIYDHNGGGYSKSEDVTSGGTYVATANLDDNDYADFKVLFGYEEPPSTKRSRCFDVRTNANGTSELPYDLTTSAATC